jgi:ABC-type transport system involved in multi-copper enzyme maturation permease subunit
MFTIAQNTIRELVRNKFFSLILFLGVIFILIAFALETLALGEIKRMLYDFGLSFIELTGLAVILFLGGGMIAREIEGRTIYLMLSKPIARSSIILGKFIGFGTVMLMMVAFQTIVLITMLMMRGIEIDTLLYYAILGIVIKLFILLGLILFFSSFVSPMIAMFLTIASYMIGHSGYTLLEYARFGGEVMMAYVGQAILIFFPNLEALNLKNYVATDAPLILSNWFTGYAMGILYIFVILILTSWIFSRRSFDNA